MRRDAGRHALAGLDGHREGRLVALTVGLAHHRQVQLLGALLRDRKTDQSPGMLRHEIDGFRRRHLGRNDDVSLVFPIFGIDQDVHAPVTRILDDGFGGRNEGTELAVAHANSLSRAR